jgi:hypothetical protein
MAPPSCAGATKRGATVNQAEQLASLKQAAWDARDLDLFTFYNQLENELERLRAVGRVVASIYQKAGFGDEEWNGLFDALFDAGLLNVMEPDQ